MLYFILLLKDRETCIKYKLLIENFLKKELKLELNRKSKYFPNKMGINFCGYRIFETHRLLRNSSKRRIKRRIRRWNKKYLNNDLNIQRIIPKINSWLGHVGHCISYNLTKKVLNKCYFLLTDSTYESLDNDLHKQIENNK